MDQEWREVIGIIEAPLNLDARVSRLVGSSLPASLVAIAEGPMLPESTWFYVDGWVTQLEDGIVFRTLQWPPGGHITPSEAYGYPFTVTVPYAGMQPAWKDFQWGITRNRNVAHLLCIDLSKRGPEEV